MRSRTLDTRRVAILRAAGISGSTARHIFSVQRAIIKAQASLDHSLYGVQLTIPKAGRTTEYVDHCLNGMKSAA
jgi:hypothetical protein